MEPAALVTELTLTIVSLVYRGCFYLEECVDMYAHPKLIQIQQLAYANHVIKVVFFVLGQPLITAPLAQQGWF
jgi:hypothetical protein